MGVGTGLWQPLRLDLRSQLSDAPWVLMQKQRPAELKLNLSEIQLQTSPHLFISSAQPKTAYRPSFTWEFSVIDCGSLDFQGLTGRMCEGTGMLSWPPRPLINAVCTADLYHTARKRWERLCFSTLPLSSWKQWRSYLDGRNTASNPPRCSDNLLLPPLLPISGQDVAQRQATIAKVDETGLADRREP